MSIADIAGPTISPIASILNDLSGLAQTEWNVVECTYLSNLSLSKSGPLKSFSSVKPARFMVFSGSDTYNAAMSQATELLGRRKVIYRFAYVDGQTTDDLGRRGEEITLDVLFWGDNYLQGLDRWIKELNQPGPGILTHPVRGRLPVTPEECELVHESQTRKAVALRVKFIEHTFTISQLTASAPNKASTLKSALQAAMKAVGQINDVATTIQSTVFSVRNLSQQIAAAVNAYGSSYTELLQALNITFNIDGSSSDLPGLLPVNEGGNATGGGSVAQTNFPVANSTQDPFAPVIGSASNSPVSALTTTEATDQVNGLRAQVQAIISQLESSTVVTPASQQTDGSLFFHDEILALKLSANRMLETLQAGIASSQSALVSYTTPRDMSIREVAFACGLDVNLSYYIELQNPWILSSNLIPSGTTLQVPVS